MTNSEPVSFHLEELPYSQGLSSKHFLTGFDAIILHCLFSAQPSQDGFLC
jgi:hypothetical protein